MKQLDPCLAKKLYLYWQKLTPPPGTGAWACHRTELTTGWQAGSLLWSAGWRCGGLSGGGSRDALGFDLSVFDLRPYCRACAFSTDRGQLLLLDVKTSFRAETVARRADIGPEQNI